MLTSSYHHIPAKPRTEASNMISQTLPMAAMFMRNKLMSWSAIFLAIQSYLSEPINKPTSGKESGAQPPLLRVLFALISLSTCYLDIFFPSTNPALRKDFSQKVSEKVSDTVSTIASKATS